MSSATFAVALGQDKTSRQLSGMIIILGVTSILLQNVSMPEFDFANHRVFTADVDDDDETVVEVESKGSTPQVEGRGQSKGGQQPGNLKEQLAVEETMSNPSAGRELKGLNTDPRWPASEGWTKQTQNVNGVEVHYQYNPKTGQIDDFKIK
jgi:hypothetical protein